MKFTLYMMLTFVSPAFAQIQVKINKCEYDGKDLYLKVQIINCGSSQKNILIDSSLEIVQMPYNPKGDELSKRLRSNLPEAFILSYLSDTLIKDFKFYWKDIPHFINFNIQPKATITRDYRATIIGDITRDLLNSKSASLNILLYLVYKIDGITYSSKSNFTNVFYLN